MRKREVMVVIAAGLIALTGCGSKTDTGSSQTASPPGVPGGPPTGPAGNAAAGKTIYLANCAGCHGENGAGRRPGMPQFNTAAWQSDNKDDADILATIKNGKGKMPAFGGKLNDQQQHDVVAYLRTLAAAK